MHCASRHALCLVDDPFRILGYPIRHVWRHASHLALNCVKPRRTATLCWATKGPRSTIYVEPEQPQLSNPLAWLTALLALNDETTEARDTLQQCLSLADARQKSESAEIRAAVRVIERDRRRLLAHGRFDAGSCHHGSSRRCYGPNVILDRD